MYIEACMAAQVRFAHHRSIRKPRKHDRNRNETYSAYLFSGLVNDDKRHTPEKLGINNPVPPKVREKYYFRPCAVPDRSRRR
jgi:hypothetical protein